MSRHSKGRFFSAVKTLVFKFCAEKVQNIKKHHLICVKHEEKTVKEFKKHIFLVGVRKSQDFAKSQKFFAHSHNRETVTFRNSGNEKKKAPHLITKIAPRWG